MACRNIRPLIPAVRLRIGMPRNTAVGGSVVRLVIKANKDQSACATQPPDADEDGIEVSRIARSAARSFVRGVKK